MESYVRKCTLFAIVCLFIGLLLIVSSSTHTRSKVASEEIVGVTTLNLETNAMGIHSADWKKQDTKLPDEGHPDHANAVEPPTESELTTETKIVDLPDYSAEPLSEKTEAGAVVVATITKPKVETSNPAPTTTVIGRYASLVDKISADDKEELARLIYHESRGIGGEAVCETVFNRMLSDEFPNTVHEVIHQTNPIQFSPASILWTAEIDEPEALERCREIVDEVLYADDSNRFIPVDYCFFNSLKIRTPREGDYEYGGNVFFKSYT